MKLIEDKKQLFAELRFEEPSDLLKNHNIALKKSELAGKYRRKKK